MDSAKQIAIVQRKVTFRLYPTRRQADALARMRRLHQRLYNAALEQRIAAWRSRRHSVTFAEQCRDLTELRAAEAEYAALNAQSAQVTLKRVDLAFQHFFRRVRQKKDKAGFPRFRSLDRFSSWGYKTHGVGWRLLGGKEMRHGGIRISGVGVVKLRGKARTPGEPVTCEIQHKVGRWYASVTVDCEPARARGHAAIGVDWGVEAFATLAYDDGSIEQVDNPRHLRRAQTKLLAAQRSLSRKKRGSRNRGRARVRVAALHRQVANRRNDFLHQQTSRLATRSRLIATESLNVKNLTAEGGRRKAGLNRAILDTAPALFLQMLRTKAEEAAVELVEVPTRSVKPSQTCSACGAQRKKELRERTHCCAACGLVMGRDENAARVMLSWALARASGREPAGCGEGGLPPPTKHETPSAAA